MNEDGLKPSPLLGYKLAPPAKGYYVGPIIPTRGDSALFRERLILDIVNYITEHSILNDIFDSLVFFSNLIFEYHNNRIFMEDNTPQKNIFKLTSSYEDIPLECKIIADSSVLVLPYIYTSLKDVSLKDLPTVNEVKYSTSKPIEMDTTKIKNYPDIQSVLNKVSQMAKTNNNTKVTTVLSALYILIDRVDKAIKIYKYKLANNSMEDFDHYNLGVIYLEQKNARKAREQFEKVKELDEARYHLGMTYFNEGEWEKASDYFNEFVEECRPEYEPPIINNIRLDQFIHQFSCNNLGICLYRDSSKKSLRERAVEALAQFQKAASWKAVTLRPDGEDNARLISDELTDIITERGKSKVKKAKHPGFPNIIGNSDAMQKVYRKIDEALDSDFNVLILGESGTGKEEVAKAIHDNGSRKDGSFIKQNCAAIPGELLERELFGHTKGSFTGAVNDVSGKFMQADNGILFLDEIGEISLEAQAKLLRVVQDKEITMIGGKYAQKVNVQILFATNKDLRKAISEGNFRNDLYQRISGIIIKLPSLDERREDIPILASHFIEKYIKESNDSTKNLVKPELSDHALNKLASHDWSSDKLSGNIRELKVILDRAVNRTVKENREIIYSFDIELPSDEDSIRMETIEALELEEGNRTKAAERLGVKRQTVHNRIKKYNIDVGRKSKKSKDENI